MATINDVLNSLNKNTEYKKIRDLEVNKEYIVESLNLVKTNYGKSILVETTEFKCYLPSSWTSKISQDALKVMNNSCPWLRLIFKGTVELPGGKTKHDIEFKACKQ